MRIKYFFILLIISFPYTGISQYLDPLEISKLYLSSTGFPEKDKYYCCEFDKRKSDDSTLGMFFAENIIREYEVIEQSDNSAVISATIYDPVDVFDTYLYFKNQNGWKLEAQRGLALTGLAFMFIKDYENDSTGKYKIMPDSLKEQVEFLYKTAKLQIKPDKGIIEHFLNNQNQYQNLLSLVKTYDNIDADSFSKFQKTDSLLLKYKNDALIHQISMYEYSPIDKAGLNDCYFFMIGGVLDNTVGYLYCENINSLPEISKGGFIMIKKISNGWYLYKTT